MAPSGPKTGAAGSRTCSPGALATTGADHVAPPSLDTAVTSWRSPIPSAGPPCVTFTPHAATTTRSPLGRASTPSLDRTYQGSGPGGAWIATTAGWKVRPPSLDLATSVESAWPCILVLLVNTS